MKYLYQTGIIFLFTFLGETMSRLIPLPIPAAIWGLILLLLALMLKIIEPEQIKETSRFLAALLPALFVAPTVGLMDQGKTLLPQLPAVILIVALSTVLTFGISGMITQKLRKGKQAESHE